MNEEEKKIMDLLVEAHNRFMNLTSTHPSEKPDWVDGIHSLQDVIGGRVLRRDYPDQFITA